MRDGSTTRGGQVGNKNALKHGFYAKVMDKADLADLRKMLNAENLDDEIAMMRVLTRKVAEQIKSTQKTDDVLAVANAFGIMSTRLAGLLRAQQYLTGGANSQAQIIADALSDLADEMGLQ